MCRSRRELSNEYLLAKIGVDTAENKPLEVWGKIQFNIHFTPYAHLNRRYVCRQPQPAMCAAHLTPLYLDAAENELSEVS